MHAYRFFADENTGTIYRGRLVKDAFDHADTWLHYWDADSLVAFYDEGYQGVRACTETEDTARAITAHLAEKAGLRGSVGALKALAVRLTDNTSPDAEFVVVHLDRGMDLYVHAWSGDPDHVWRDEIEAVWNGDVWRIEVQEYAPGMGPFEGGADSMNWVDGDTYPEEFYGSAHAEQEHARLFPLDAFPAERTISGGE